MTITIGGTGPDIKRCEECGSWDAQCGSAKPVAKCGCARCLSAAVAALTAERDALRAENDALFRRFSKYGDCNDRALYKELVAITAKRDALREALCWAEVYVPDGSLAQEKINGVRDASDAARMAPGG